MSSSQTPLRHAALARTVRDRMAAVFAASISSEAAGVLEVLEQQLATTPEREKWRPLREAIDLLRTVLPGFDGAVRRHVIERYDAKLSPGDNAMSKTSALSLSALSLVADDEVQEEIVVGNATRRLREVVAEELFLVTERLAEALGGGSLAEDRNPAYPRVFARALLDSLAAPGVSAQARFTAFGAFSPALLAAMPATYKAANALLEEHGILPNLKRSYGAPQAVGGNARVTTAPGPAAVPGREAQLFERIVATANSGASGGAASAAPAPGAVASGDTAGATAGLVTVQIRPELVAALRALESRASHGAEANASLGSVRAAKEAMSASLTPVDSLVADLVEALFERLFAGAALTDRAKAQIGRLQVPVLKAALADRALFTDPHHPIRGLIDAMAELGASPDEPRVDGRSPTEWLVAETEALVASDPSETAAFADARDRLAAIAERHHDAEAELDEVVALLREDEKRLTAVQDASLEIAHRVGAAHCPVAAASFAFHAWRPVLAHDHRGEGKGGTLWQADLETLEDLLWTLTPRVTEAERLRLTTLLPSLRYRMKQGFLRAGMTRADADALMDQMSQIHAELERSPAAAAHGELRVTAGTPSSYEDDVTATLNVASRALEDEGLVRGAWFEFTEEDGRRHRCRLNWVSPVQGACVFKDLSAGRSFAIALDELRSRRAAGRAVAVDGPGFAGPSIEAALHEVARERGAETDAVS